MTPTTDLQKPFTDEQLKAWANLKDKPLLEQFEGLPDWTVLPPLAARVIELEAENKRLREGLSEIISLAEEAGDADFTWRYTDIARTTLKGGEK